VIDFFTFTSAIFNFLTFYAVFRLRKLFPEKPRPFRTPAFLPVFLTVILIQIAFAVFTFLTSPFASLAGLALTSTGLIYWHLAVSSEVKENLRGNDPQKKFL
jgi:amino acid transporter